MHSTPRLSDVMGFPRCDIADIDWYVRLPRDPHLVDPKVEMQSELCKEEDSTLELTSLMKGNWLPH